MGSDADLERGISWAQVAQWGIAAAQAVLLLMLSQQWAHEQLQDKTLTDLRIATAEIQANRFTQQDGVELERSCRLYADSRPHPVMDLERRVARSEVLMDRCCSSTSSKKR